ncbi:MAG: ABC transporter substrate-binding protein [Patescibacteria group bacterium]
MTALVSLSGIVDASRAGNRRLEAIAGGTYHEGILLPAPRDIESATKNLTHIGLVDLAADGQVEPALATSWQMSDDQQTLKVTLGDQLTALEALRLIQDQAGSGYWKDATITTPDPATLQFALTKPWANFIKELATPIFPYGPFQIEANSKPDSSVLKFIPNPNTLKDPYFKHLELHFYTDATSLDRAARKGVVDAVYSGDGGELTIPKNWSTIHPKLGINYLVFFNLRHDNLNDAGLRHRLVQAERLDTPLDLRLAVPDTPQLSAMAESLKQRWAPANINLIIESYPILTLTKSILPDHNYDLVLLGIDYGPDGDLFSFWHSSQIASPGRNLAGYRNKEVDQLLDAARLDPDQTKRQERYGRVNEILGQEAVIMRLDEPQTTFARSAKVKGPMPAESLRTAGDRWQGITGWYLKERFAPSK